MKNNVKLVYVNQNGQMTIPLKRLKPVQIMPMQYVASSSQTVKETRTAQHGSMSDIVKQRWVCGVCKKSLSSKRSYNEHMNTHTDRRPFACQFCEYAAASQMTLRRHVLRNHTSRRDWGYKCPYCVETYMEPASYQNHVQTHHFGRSATYGCPYVMCTFDTKCFRHFRESHVTVLCQSLKDFKHLVKHTNCEAFNGDPVRVPHSYADEDLTQYLIDDEFGVGYSYMRRGLVRRRVLATDTVSQGQNQRRRILARPITVQQAQHQQHPQQQATTESALSPTEYDDGRPVLEAVNRAPSIRTGTAPRRVYHQLSEYALSDKPPKLEQEFMPVDEDWIEQEIEVTNTELQAWMPDGQVDMELD